MAVCPICRENEADKENVHLIPWFLIKNCITERGTGDRDMELSFTIEPSSFTKIYTGRSVLPEKVEKFGTLHDLQKEKENPYSRDNLICGKCEENLSRLEAIFASKFTRKKIKNACNSKLQKINGHSVLIDTKYNLGLYQLLIQSIFYRCSIGRFDGFVLQSSIKSKIEDNLRSAFLIHNFKKIKPSDQINLIYPFPLITSSFFIPDGDELTKKFIVANKSRFPYFIMAGRWMFQLFEAEKHLKSSVEWLYGLHASLRVVDAYCSIKKSAHIILLDEKSGVTILENCLKYFTEKRIVGLKKNIRDLHQRIFNKKPNTFISEYIFQQYLIHKEQNNTEFESLVFAFLDLKKLP